MFDWQEWRLRRIARRLTHFELKAAEPDDADFTSADVYEELLRKKPNPLFLGFYTRAGLEQALRTYGTLDRMSALGLQPTLTTHHPDERRNLLRISDGPGGPAILELQVRFAAVRALQSIPPVETGDILDLLAVEWLLLQNPRKRFSPDRLPLPGQEHPGLGLGREILTLLDVMCERLGREGLIGFPEHQHNALLYSRKYRFFDPRREGELAALLRDLEGLDFASTAWAVEDGLVLDGRTGLPYRWTGEEMVRPLAPRLQAYFAGRAYVEEAERVRRECRFTYDPAAVAARMQQVRQRCTETVERA